MKKWLYAGTLLFIVQIGMALLIHSNVRQFEAFTPQAALLSFSPHEVDVMKVFGQDSNQVTLTKVNGKWLFPAQKHRVPADNAKIEDLLKKLATLKQGLAVATTKGAAKRFEVSEDVFQRHIILQKGDQIIADFYLGTSPGFKMVHARVQGRDEIVSVKLNTYDIETDYDNWLDRDMLKVAKDTVKGLAIGEIELTKKDNSWTLMNQTEGEEVNGVEIDNLVERISSLPVEGIVDFQESSKLFEQKPDLEITMTLSDNSSKTYTFAKPEEENHYLLKSSDHEYLLKVNSWTVDEIKKVDSKVLVTSKDTDHETKDNKNSPSAGQG